jgi:hypothetical protein
LMAEIGPQNPGKGGIAGVVQNKGFAGKHNILGPTAEKNSARHEMSGIAQSNRDTIRSVG